MRIAFHAPMKPPDHPVPSGDRRMARAFMALLEGMGHEVELASRLRSYDRHGDDRRQARLAELGRKLAGRLVRRYRACPPASRPRLWFTYHLYHKAPDLLGPAVARALGIPYVVAEASVSARQASGPWACGHAASLHAIGQANLVLAMTRKDLSGLQAALPGTAPVVLFPPFLESAPFVAASVRREASRRQLAEAQGLDTAQPWLSCVAMMRADAKRDSYTILAQALQGLTDLPWLLLVVGDGEARAEVEAMLAPFADRTRFLGAVAPAALADIYAAADLHVWPACNEAYGMALLEAQAAAVPVVAGAEGGVPDIVADGETGLLARPRDPSALAAALRRLLVGPQRRREMAAAAQRRVLERHDAASAARCLGPLLDGLGAAVSTTKPELRCASA